MFYTWPNYIPDLLVESKIVRGAWLFMKPDMESVGGSLSKCEVS